MPGGPEGLRQMAVIPRTTFAELHYEAKEVIAEEDCVAARTILYGTHNGPFCWLPPTGHQIAPTITFLYNSYVLLSYQPESL